MTGAVVAAGGGGGGAPRLVAAATDGIYSSDDGGATWVKRHNVSNIAFNDVMWVPQRGLFVAVGAQSGVSDTVVAWSPNGLTWTGATAGAASGALVSLAYSPTLDRFVAIGGSSGGWSYYADSNLAAWTAISDTFSTGSDQGRNVLWAEAPESRFVNITTGGGAYYSALGNIGSWLLGGLGAGFGSPSGLTYSPTLDRFVACGNATFRYSPDFANWTTVTSVQDPVFTNPGITIYNVRWFSNVSLFIAVGASGRIGTSPDGINWTRRDAGVVGTTVLLDVNWCSSISKFVVVGGGSQIATSLDGITWTGVSTSDLSRNAIAG